MIVFLQKTNLTKGIHTRYRAGYKVWATEVDSRNKGGITILWMEEEGWHVEGAMVFGQDVVCFTITAGRKLWYVLRSYVLRNDKPSVHWVYHALAQVPAGLETLMAVDLNVRWVQPQYH